MKKIVVSMFVLLLIITGCAKNEEDYNKELGKIYKQFIKFDEDNPYTEESTLKDEAKFFNGISIFLDDASKLKLKDTDLSAVNEFFALRAKVYNEYSVVFEEYSKDNSGPIEELDDDLIDEIFTKIEKISEGYENELKNSEEKSLASLSKLLTW